MTSSPLDRPINPYHQPRPPNPSDTVVAMKLAKDVLEQAISSDKQSLLNLAMLLLQQADNMFQEQNKRKQNEHYS